MTESLKADLALIGAEVIRVANDRFTGNICINLSMNQGGIGQINVKIDKNLKNNPSLLRKNKTF